MNKILAYTVIAILLGTVTMVAPLALLGPSDSTPDTEHTPTVPQYTMTDPEAAEPSNQDRTYEEDSQMLEGGNFSTETWTKPEPSPVEPEPPAVTEPAEPSSQEPELTAKTAETPSDLSPVGLMTIPSFLVAVGVFVYLRKRMS